MHGNQLEIVEMLTDFFAPPVEANSDDEMHHFLIARKL